MVNEYHSDRLKNTMNSGTRNKAVSTLVAIRGFCLFINDGTRATLNANTLMDKVASCQLCISLL